MIKLALFAGDGIGPEVAGEAVDVLKFLFDYSSIRYEIEEDLIGGASYDEYKKPVTERALKIAKEADAVIFGAVGGPRWESLPIELRPEKALLTLRYDLELYANLRPAKIYEELIDASPLKKDIVRGTDMMIVRELTGGIYFGQPRGVFNMEDGQRKGINTLVYTTKEIERIAKIAFEIARKRRRPRMESRTRTSSTSSRVSPLGFLSNGKSEVAKRRLPESSMPTSGESGRPSTNGYP